MQWQTAAGRTLAAGNARLRVPAGDAEVVAYDARRRIRTKMKVAPVVDYASLPRGLLTVRALPFADVVIGVEPVGSTPVNRVDVVAGRYDVTLLHAGKKIVRSVDVAPGREAIVSVNVEAP